LLRSFVNWQSPRNKLMAPLENTVSHRESVSQRQGDASLCARKSLTRESRKAFFTVVSFCFKFDASTNPVKPPKSNPMNILPPFLKCFLRTDMAKIIGTFLQCSFSFANVPKMDFPRLQRALKNLKYNNDKNGRWHVSFNWF